MSLVSLVARDRRDLRFRRRLHLLVAGAGLVAFGVVGWSVISATTRFGFGSMPVAPVAISLAIAIPTLAITVAATIRSWRLRMDAGSCAACGYPLKGTTGRCPECGTPKPETAAAAAAATVPWKVPAILLAGDALALLPLHGYFVRAGRDSQLIWLVMLLAWFIAIGLVIATLVLAVLRPPDSRVLRSLAIASLILLPLVIVVGYGGLQHAFFELIAG